MRNHTALLKECGDGNTQLAVDRAERSEKLGELVTVKPLDTLHELYTSWNGDYQWLTVACSQSKISDPRQLRDKLNNLIDGAKREDHLPMPPKAPNNATKAASVAQGLQNLTAAALASDAALTEALRVHSEPPSALDENPISSDDDEDANSPIQNTKKALFEEPVEQTTK